MPRSEWPELALFEVGGYAVVAEAADWRFALRAVVIVYPHRVLDIQFPDLNRLTVAELVAGQRQTAFISFRSANSFQVLLADSSAARFMTRAEVAVSPRTGPRGPR